MNAASTLRNLISRSSRTVAGIAAALVAVSLAGAAAHAGNPDPSNGEQAGTLSSTAFITVSGNTVTITEPTTPVTLTTGGKTGNLLGISGIWVVSKTGAAESTVTATSGSVTSSAHGNATWTSGPWSDGYDGFHDDANGSGYGSGAAWLQLDSADSNGSGYTSGTFTFTGLSSLSDYTFCLDYSADNGMNTGRSYITNFTATPAAAPAAVPEPGVYVTGCSLFGMTGLGMIRGRRRSRKSAAK